MQLRLDDIALMSPLRKKNTLLKILVAMIGLMAGIFSLSPIVSLFVAACMIFITLFPGKVPRKYYFRLLFATMGFAFISCVTIAFFSGGATGKPLFSHKLFFIPLVVTTSSLNQAVLIFCRAVGGLCSIFFLSMTTPMIEMFSFMKKFSFLDIFSELMMLIYRYIFVFIDILFNIQSAQSMRFGYSNFRSTLASLGMLAGTLFIRTIEQGDKLFLSMNSRCYDGKLTYFEPNYPITFKDAFFSFSFVIVLVCVYYFASDFNLF